MQFGAAFATYKPLGIEHIAFSDTKPNFDDLSHFGVSVNKAELPEVMPTGQFLLGASKSVRPYLVLNSSGFSDGLKKALNKMNVGVAPTSNAYLIPPEQSGLSPFIKGTMPYYDYYMAELGINVSVGDYAKISSLLCHVDLLPDTPQRTDVTAYDVMPNWWRSPSMLVPRGMLLEKVEYNIGLVLICLIARFTILLSAWTARAIAK